MISDKNIEYQEDIKVHFVNLAEQVISLNDSDKIRLINIISSELNLKPLKKVAQEKGKSYNGLKMYGNPVVIANKYFGISEINDTNLPF